MTLDMKYVRDQFPGLHNGWTFFDNAGGSQILGGVVDKISHFLINHNAQLGGSYDVSTRAANIVSESRGAIATLLNASRAEEIVFGPTSTSLLQLLSRAMSSQLQAGDEIIITNSDHESNIGPWDRLQEKGVVLKKWDVNPETYELELEQLQSLMTDKTKLVCVVHASNLLGTINPIKEIAKLVHDNGAQICVDAVAYAPHRAIDVTDWDVDYYVFSLYKTYGPHFAVMYGKHDLLLKLDNQYHYFYPEDKVPAKLEPGNASYELTYGASGIVDYLAELGTQAGCNGSTREKLVAAYEDMTAQENLIAERLLSYLRGRNDCQIIGLPKGDDPRRVPTISFVIDGQDPEEVCKKVDGYNIAIRFGDFHARRLADDLGLSDNKGVLRVSMTHYNTVEEVDALIKALDDVLSS